jgi:hypothetical protein
VLIIRIADDPNRLAEFLIAIQSYPDAWTAEIHLEMVLAVKLRIGYSHGSYDAFFCSTLVALSDIPANPR